MNIFFRILFLVIAGILFLSLYLFLVFYPQSRTDYAFDVKTNLIESLDILRRQCMEDYFIIYENDMSMRNLWFEIYDQIPSSGCGISYDHIRKIFTISYPFLDEDNKRARRDPIFLAEKRVEYFSNCFDYPVTYNWSRGDILLNIYIHVKDA